MPIDLKSFRKWIRLVYATQDQELDCEGFNGAIPQYVDVEIAGGKAHQRFPEVHNHMQQCPRCRDLYLALREAALQENREEAQWAASTSGVASAEAQHAEIQRAEAQHVEIQRAKPQCSETQRPQA